MDKEVIINVNRKIKCHFCSEGIKKGQRFMWFGSYRGYQNICWNCFKELYLTWNILEIKEVENNGDTYI